MTVNDSSRIAASHNIPTMPHLILVDDDDLFRESLSLNLIDEGYHVTSSVFPK